MSNNKKKVYLVKDCQLNFVCYGETKTKKQYQGQSNRVQLQLNNLKNYPDEKYNDIEICEITKAIKQAVAGNNAFLTILANYEEFYDSYKILMKFNMTKDFINTLCTALAAPKTSVEGTYTCRYSANGTWLEHQPNIYQFSLREIDLKEEQNICDFEGSSKMVELLNKSPQSTQFYLKFSILLHWRDSKFDFQGLEINVLEKLFDEKILADCCLVSSSQTEVQCHRNVLAAHSDVFHAMLTSGFKESSTNKIEMADVSNEGINIFLTYLYKKQINTDDMSEEIALELLQTAHKYNISALEKIILEMLFHKSDELYNINSVLCLYFMTVNVEAHHMLCEKMLRILKRNTKTLRTSTVYKELMEKNAKEAAELAFKLLEFESN